MCDEILKMSSEAPVNVIAADHPLLDKFQKKLAEHLNRINEQLIKENGEIENQIEALNDEREDIGSKLFDIQQQLEHQKKEIDSYNEQIGEIFEKRVKLEEDTRQAKMELKMLNDVHLDAKRMYNERGVELKKMQSLAQTIDKWQKEMEHNLKVSKMMLSKDLQEKSRISKEKREMDLFLLNIGMEVMKSETKSQGILAELQENERQISQLNLKLIESNADLDALQTYNRRLISSWNDVIHDISKRDKQFDKVSEELM